MDEFELGSTKIIPSIGDIIEITDEEVGKYGKYAVVEKLKTWGIIAYIPTDQGDLFLRIKHKDYVTINQDRAKLLLFTN